MNVERNNKSDTILETQRLILRQWRDSDLEPMIQINQDPHVMEYFVTHKTRHETSSFIANNLRLYEQVGYSLYAVELKGIGEFIGFAGLCPVNTVQLSEPAIEIDWLISPKFWGQGHATEAAIAIMDYAFNFLDIDELVSTSSLVNTMRTNKLIRLGFAHSASEDFNHPKISAGHILRRHVSYRKHKLVRN